MIDYGDIQGIVRYGYGRLTEVCFLLLAVRDRAAARDWLAAAPVTSAVEASPIPSTALQVAFTREGLDAIGVPRDITEALSPEFLSGMAGEESRSRRLGDVAANSPSSWAWGGPGTVPHVLVMLYARPGGLESWTRTVTGGSWSAAFRVVNKLLTTDLGGVEPFGFRDGISQPEPDWNRVRTAPGREQLAYGNVVALGEFLLGYPNEYGKYTERPLLARSGAPELPAAEDAHGKADLGRNGTYLVLRQLRQDVRGFWQYVDRQASGNAQARLALAESMVGRAVNGDPLLARSVTPIAGVGPDQEDIGLNQFTYDLDGAGTRCPFGAHVRRANPRNADLPGGSPGLFGRLRRELGFGRSDFRDDTIASTRFHRLLRRGRPYGEALPLAQALQAAPADDPERGLYFLCLNANISRQFEFVQNAWIMGTKFGGLGEESDPLIGNREAVAGCRTTAAFSIQQAGGLCRRLTDLPQFVTVRGGAYFFLPGIRGLRYLTRSSA